MHIYNLEHFFRLHRSSWVKIGGTVYKTDDVAAVSSNLLPLFGRIIDIFIVDVSDCYFVFELLVTECFNSHYHAFEVRKQTQQPIQLVVCKQSDLIDYHVLGLYTIPVHDDHLTFVSLKYYLPENI